MELRDVREPFALGTATRKSRLMRFSRAGLISPRCDAYLRFWALEQLRFPALSTAERLLGDHDVLPGEPLTIFMRQHMKLGLVPVSKTPC